MLSGRLADAVQRHRAVGAVAGAVHKGDRAYAAAGTASGTTPMTPATPMRIASIGKPMVAMAVFTAFRHEPAALDAPLREFFPDLRKQWRLSDEVTLRRCLSHTAGLRTLDNAGLGACGDGDDAVDRALRLECAMRTEWRPGRAWAYANVGFRYAAGVLARRYDTTFEKALADLVLTPAGMTETGFDTPPGCADGHHKGVPQPMKYFRARRPGGGLWSTAKDLLSFAEYAMADTAFLKQVRREHAKEAMGHRYGFGWFLDRRADVIFHFGDVGSFSGLLAIAPDHGVGAAAVGNDEHGGPVSRAVVFGEITAATGLRRPRPGIRRLVSGAARRTAAKVLA